MHRARRHQIHAYGLQVHRQPAGQTFHAGAVRCLHGPAGHGLRGVGAARQRDGGRGAGDEVCGCEFGEQERGEEADCAGRVDGVDCGGGEGDEVQSVAGGKDDMVQRGACGGGGGFEERLEVCLDGVGVREVAGAPADQSAEVWVAGLKTRDGVREFGLLGAGEDDGGAVLETGFGDAEADAGCAADDEDAGLGEFGDVFEAGGGHLD